jgi:arsenate reductase (glutaredoxin)
MAIKAYGLNKCSTCQDALTYLAERKVAVEFSDYSVETPTKVQIKKWMKAVGGWEKLLNRASYTWRGLSEEDKTDVTEEKAVTLAQNYTSLIRRPLIEHADGTITVGFKPKVKELL